MTLAIPREHLDGYAKKSRFHALAVDEMINLGLVEPIEQEEPNEEKA